MNAGFTGFAAWLLTYLLHSSVLIGVAWALCRWLPIRSNAIREWLWTVALFGGLLTAGFQTGLNVKPIAGTFQLPVLLFAPDPVQEPPSVQIGSELQGLLLEPREGLPFDVGTTVALSSLEAESLPIEVEPGSKALTAFKVLLAATLLLTGYTLLAMLIRAPKRRPLREGPMPELLARLKARAGMKRAVLLSVSEQVMSPVAMGIYRPEICVPVRALTELNVEQMEAMLAHELAHLIRRDPVRLLLARAVERLFFLQPLNRLARRRLFETVECRCDAFAIRQVGTGLSLAECLAEVAGWMTERNRRMPMLAMAQPGSQLTDRVSRLLREEDALAQDRGRRGQAALLSLALPVFVFLSPVVVTAADAPVVETRASTAEVESLAAAASPELEQPIAPISLLIVEAIGLLEQELDLLTQELGALHAALQGQAVSSGLLKQFIRLQGRISELNQRRQILAAWKTRMLRENGLVSSRPGNPSTGPWSNAR